MFCATPNPQCNGNKCLKANCHSSLCRHASQDIGKSIQVPKFWYRKETDTSNLVSFIIYASLIYLSVFTSNINNLQTCSGIAPQ